MSEDPRIAPICYTAIIPSFYKPPHHQDFSPIFVKCSMNPNRLNNTVFSYHKPLSSSTSRLKSTVLEPCKNIMAERRNGSLVTTATIFQCSQSHCAHQEGTLPFAELVRLNQPPSLGLHKVQRVNRVRHCAERQVADPDVGVARVREL